MKSSRPFHSVCVLFLLSGIAVLHAGSITREGEPRITFNRLAAPTVAKQGDLFQIAAYVTPREMVWEETGVFLHLLRGDGAVNGATGEEPIVINIQCPLSRPSPRWVAGEEILLGPATCKVPRDLPSGTYRYQMGLYYKDNNRGLYVREPYTNSDITQWVVGTLRVEPMKKETGDARVERLLSNFESIADVKRWEADRGAEIGLQRDSLAGSYSGLFAFSGGTSLPIVMLENYFDAASPEYTNWRLYDYLEFSVATGARGGGLARRYISLQIKDSAGNRFQKPLDKCAQTHGKGNGLRLRVPVDGIAEKIDAGNIRHLGFFAHSSSGGGEGIISLMVDDIFLVAEHGLRSKDEEPFLTFEGLTAPETVVAGSTLTLGAAFSITEPITRDYDFYLHCIREGVPAHSIQYERHPFTPPKKWEPGRTYREGPIHVPIPSDTPPGRYRIDMGFFRTVQTTGGAHYVNVYKWADDRYTMEQPNHPVDHLKLPYRNKTSREQWTVGQITVIERGVSGELYAPEEERSLLEELVDYTNRHIIGGRPRDEKEK